MSHFFYIKSSDSDLQHHGILGQKWGIRRFQNEDGTRTAAGKRREREAIKNSDLQNAVTIANSGRNLATSSREAIKSVNRFKKNEIDISKMSNKELQESITRMNLEQQYSRLKESEMSKGQAFADKVLQTGGAVLAAAGSALSIALAIKQLRSK